MVRRAPTAAIGRALVRPPRHIELWVRAHQPSIAVILSVTLGLLTALGPLTARHGSAGRWIYLAYVLPGWAVGVMAYILLTPGLVAGSGRKAVIGHCLLWSTLPVLLVQQVLLLHYFHGLDTLLLSGWLVLLIGLELAGRAPAKLRRVLQRLRDRGVLAPAEAVDSLKGGLERAGRGWSVATGSCVACALLITTPWTLEASRWPIWALGLRVSDSVLLIVGGAVAGSWLGRMASYGRLLGKATLHKQKIQLRVIPSHPDGAGGLKPIGDFHLYQSMTASLPAIFLAVWVLLISLRGPNPLWGYRSYLDQYIRLLPLAILFEVLVFVLPMSSIHAIMKSQKENVFLAEADRLFPAIATAPASLDGQADEERDAAKQRLIERYEELEKAPTWPVDSSIRRRFTLRNLGFLIPFIGYVVGHMPFWQQISDVFKGLG
jgi:hypothetical protein